MPILAISLGWQAVVEPKSDAKGRVWTLVQGDGIAVF
jgi:hypothetical protein